MRELNEIKKAMEKRLNEYKEAGVDGMVFVCQSMNERNANVNFTYVDLKTVKENAEKLFSYDKRLDGIYFRKSKTVDPLLHQPNFPIGKKILTVPTKDFEKNFEEFTKIPENSGINKGGYSEIVCFGKTVEEFNDDRSLIDGQVIIDGKVKNVQMKSSLINRSKDRTNNGCSIAELYKFKKGE